MNRVKIATRRSRGGDIVRRLAFPGGRRSHFTMACAWGLRIGGGPMPDNPSEGILRSLLPPALRCDLFDHARFDLRAEVFSGKAESNHRLVEPSGLIRRGISTSRICTM